MLQRIISLGFNILNGLSLITRASDLRIFTSFKSLALLKAATLHYHIEHHSNKSIF